MVFPTERLMTRDKEEFAQFWKLAGMQDKVTYHVGLDFEFTDTELLIIDESDTLIFGDPVAFAAVLKKARCICLTATPDDNNRKGAEK